MTSYPKDKIKIVLLEGISSAAAHAFAAEEYQVESLKGALQGDELVKKIENAHVVGIRSRTMMTKDVISRCKRLLAIGCFCIGTNQVDLEEAAENGVVTFNSPFCNTRSVAELILSVIVALSRKLFLRSSEMHSKTWNKSAAHCFEVRGKTLGIVGYGHIGTQLSVLAEALGMTVIFHDVRKVMPYSKSKQVTSLDELLRCADFVSMHVPATPETAMMVGAEQFATMKKGAYFMNASRGSVVDLDALAAALRSGHLRGAYIDVFPKEPKANTGDWEVVLQGIPNVILTPHIGGSTEEAQEAIGDDVSSKLVRFINLGDTDGAVNMPNLSLPIRGMAVHRIITIHKNVPGVLGKLDGVMSNVNILQCSLGTQGNIGYVMHQIEADGDITEQMKKEFSSFPEVIFCRIIF